MTEFWLPHEDEFLRRYYRVNSASWLARHLLRSRNAIIGRASRLGLSMVKPLLAEARRNREMDPAYQIAVRSKHRKRQYEYRQRLRERAIQAMNDAPPEPPPAIEPHMPVHLLDLQWHHCRSIVGYDPNNGMLALYCGHPIHNGSSFCAAHHARYYQSVRR